MSKSHLMATRVGPSLIFTQPLNKEVGRHDVVWLGCVCSSLTRPGCVKSGGLLCYSVTAALEAPPGGAPAIHLLLACYISLVAGLTPCSQQQAISVLMFSATCSASTVV